MHKNMDFFKILNSQINLTRTKKKYSALQTKSIIEPFLCENFQQTQLFFISCYLHRRVSQIL